MNTAAYVIFALAVLTAAVTDLRSSRIPNWVTFPGALIGVAFHALATGVDGAVFGVTGWGAGFALTIGFYAVGGMGAGDVKLVAMVGAFLGASRVLWVAIYTALFGGIYALGIVVYSLIGQVMRTRDGKLHQAGGFGLGLLNGSTRPTAAWLRKFPRLRYAIVVALGVVVEAWYGPLRF